MDNILINFTADAAGLQPGIDGLLQLETVDKELAASVKKTAAEMTKRDKAVSDSAKAGKKDIEGLATAFKNLDKSAVGGTYNKSLQTLMGNLKGTKDEFQQLNLVLEVAKKKLADLNPGTSEWKELNDLVGAGTEILKTFGEAEEKTSTQTKSLRSELRAMKEEIATRQVAGESGPAIDALIQKAGELDDALKDVAQQISQTGSDTRNIEGFVQIMATATQTIAGAQAAQALLGTENEQFEQALVKLNALMLLSNSLQAIQQSLQKESAAVLLIENAQRKISALATELQTAAESKNIVVRYAAAAAQRVLNAVMAANPIGIVIVALASLASLVLVFTSRVTDAARAQGKLNGALNEGGKLLEADLAGIDRANKRILSDMKARGVTDVELAKQEVSNINVRNKARQESLNKLRKVYDETVAVDDATAKSKSELGDTITRIESEISNDYVDALAKRGEAERQGYLSSLKSATAYSEARVAQAKKGSEAELQAQIAAIRARIAEEKKSNPNLTSGERAKIEAEGVREIADLRFAFQKKALEDAMAAIDAQVLKAKEGSREEFDFRLQALQAARDLELKDQELAAGKKKLIDANYYRERQKLVEAFNQKQAEDVINSRVAENQAQLSILQLNNVAETNGKVLELRKNLIDEQAALEVIGIQASEKHEELRRLRISAVYQKALVDKQQLERQKAAAEIENDFNYSDKKYQAEILKNQAVLFDVKSTAAERKQAEADVTRFSQIQTDNYYNYLKNKLDAHVISEDEYYDALAAKDLEYWNQRLQIVQQSSQFEQQLRERAYGIAKQIGDGLFAIDSERYARDQEANQQRFDKKLITEREYNNRKKEIDRAQANARKQQAIFDIGVDTAKTIFQIQAQAAILASNPLTLPLAAKALAQIPFVIGESIIATAFILAKKYKTGGMIEGPGSGTSDSIPIWASKGEYVTKAEMTAKHKLALEAINNNKFQDYLIKYEMPKIYNQFSMPVVPQVSSRYVETRTTEKIDYREFASAFAKELASSPHVNISLDENGFNISVQKGLETIEYKNKKLLM